MVGKEKSSVSLEGTVCTTINNCFEKKCCIYNSFNGTNPIPTN